MYRLVSRVYVSGWSWCARWVGAWFLKQQITCCVVVQLHHQALDKWQESSHTERYLWEVNIKMLWVDWTCWALYPKPCWMLIRGLIRYGLRITGWLLCSVFGYRSRRHGKVLWRYWCGTRECRNARASMEDECTPDGFLHTAGVAERAHGATVSIVIEYLCHHIFPMFILCSRIDRKLLNYNYWNGELYWIFCSAKEIKDFGFQIHSTLLDSLIFF